MSNLSYLLCLSASHPKFYPRRLCSFSLFKPFKVTPSLQSRFPTFAATTSSRRRYASSARACRIWWQALVWGGCEFDFFVQQTSVVDDSGDRYTQCELLSVHYKTPVPPIEFEEGPAFGFDVRALFFFSFFVFMHEYYCSRALTPPTAHRQFAYLI
ncbi:hypothetical protein BJ138DRAFT_1168425 [Hygrophoropsis aurantiaca]|uniref:Uncharacterized protein n=1 Tax=Hygrophoropsis aurantiaca TaxID=72124 RepID=A0ACB7ZPW3_9AGAM|nr:hypothetical protein BJ138DRAFT_1168425 [Hygrophoropsis aurantiaca]